ncbi:MAG TPA: matrixin family metalloprotease [Thermoanaerobaculia bacterium]|nr:matrixin family metalloprotease [Thermoanaerobaculia bacterium]
MNVLRFLHRRGALVLASAATGAGLLAGTLSGYVLLVPNRTWDCPPDYTVDSAGIASIADGDGGATRVAGAIASIVAWNGENAGTVIKAHKGSVAGFAMGDGNPMLKFSDPFAACTGVCLAATFTGYYAERTPTPSGSWKITDADIVTNNTGYSWTSEGEDPGGAGCSSEIYAEGVMVHEAGHGLGLGHSGVAGATMLASVSFCNNNPSTTEADDAAGLQALYGSGFNFGYTTYTNYINTAGVTHYQPCGTYYWGNAGNQVGALRGPGGSDFDLYLWKWNGTTWVQVASATTTSTNENITYSGTAAWYLWGVYSYSGSGTYHFYTSHP